MERLGLQGYCMIGDEKLIRSAATAQAICLIKNDKIINEFVKIMGIITVFLCG